jgi:lipoate-protein ligase A
MFSKAKMGMLMGTMAVVLSLGSIGGAMAANSAQTTSFNKPAEVKFKTGKMGHHGGVGFKENTELLALLKLDADKLKEELQAGKTLAAIAQVQGVDTADVVALLVEQQEAKLKEAVTAGKLTQEQADKLSEILSDRVKEQVENTKPDKGFGKGGFIGGFEKNEELLSLLKLDADKLQEELKAKKTLAAIAEAQGVSVDDLVALLVKQQEAKLKEAVTAGKLTQEQADKMNENASERVKEMVQNSHHGRGPGKGMGMEKNEDLLSLLKLDADKLKEEQKAGKSLATIATEQGVEVDDVIELLVGQHEAKLKEAVEAGKLTQEQADKRSEELTAMVQKMVNGSFEKVVFPRHEKEEKDQEETM